MSVMFWIEVGLSVNSLAVLALWLSIKELEKKVHV